VDATDSALSHGLADVRAAAGQLAVVAGTRTSDLQTRSRLVGDRLTGDRRRPPVTDVHEPFVGKRQERMPDGSRFQPLELGEIGHRRQGVTWGQLPGADRCPYAIRGLLPFGPPVGRVGPQVRDVAMLSEGLASAPEVAASYQASVEGYPGSGRGPCGPGGSRERA